MKKIFAPVIGLCMGFGLTSCDTESLAQWLPILMQVGQGLLTGNGQSDDSYVFNGTANLSMYNYNASANTYDQDSRISKNVSTTATVTVYAYEDTPCVTITFADMSVGNLIVKDFSFTTYYNYETGVIDAEGPSYLTGGTCTVNGVKKEIPAAALKGAITQNGNTYTLKLTDIYFQVDDKVFTGSSYQGTCTVAAE